MRFPIPFQKRSCVRPVAAVITTGPPPRACRHATAGPWMGSPDQVPVCFTGNCARDIRRSVLIVAAAWSTITSLVLLSRGRAWWAASQIASASTASDLPCFTYGLTYNGGIRQTVCPRFESSRAQWWLDAQASMRMRTGGRRWKNARTSALRKRPLKAISRLSVPPWTRKMFLAKSRPTGVICMGRLPLAALQCAILQMSESAIERSHPICFRGTRIAVARDTVDVRCGPQALISSICRRRLKFIT
jgi:hypothetical protein